MSGQATMLLICAQLLQVGPFSEEGLRLKDCMRSSMPVAALRGKHHEIYLSDMRRADPKKWKTIIRQPMSAG
jgi:hypothetical protein